MYCPGCGKVVVHQVIDGKERQVCVSCGKVVYLNPQPCVSVLIVEQNYVLLGKRGETQIRPGEWCLPCGYMEHVETIYGAAVREVAEETGVKIQPLSIINVVTNHFCNEIHSLVVVILAKALSTVLKPGDDLVKVEWFDLSVQLPSLAFEADRHIIEKYKKQGKDFGISMMDTVIHFSEIEKSATSDF